MKKHYQMPTADVIRFECEDVLGDSDLVINPGQVSGNNGKDDETDLLPNVNGFH